MNAEKIVDSIFENNLEEMRNSVYAVLSEKAVDKLEEMKTVLAENIFVKE